MEDLYKTNLQDKQKYNLKKWEIIRVLYIKTQQKQLPSQNSKKKSQVYKIKITISINIRKILKGQYNNKNIS